MRAETELRMSTGAPEVRTAEGGLSQIVGYAAVFNREAMIAGNFRERVLPGAFRDAIVASDVRGLFNHDPSRVLGRTKAGTLRILEDEIGLRYEIDLNPNDPESVSLAAKIARGDVSGSSFRFLLPRDGQRMEPADKVGDLPLRTISRVSELIDVGPVTFPAYDETTSEARDMAEAAKTPPVAAATPAAPEARAAMTAAEGEEAAELVQYQTAAAALEHATAILAKAGAIVAGLIAAETTEPTETDEAEAAEEEVETAQLRSLLVLCSQVCGAVGGISALVQAMLADEYDPILYARAAETDADRSRRLALESARAAH